MDKSQTWRLMGGEDVGIRLSDLLHAWLREKIGNHQIDFIHSLLAGSFLVKVDDTAICMVDDVDCTVTLSSGYTRHKGEVLRRRDVLKAADPLLFDKLWERVGLINSDLVTDYNYSITCYKS